MLSCRVSKTLNHLVWVEGQMGHLTTKSKKLYPSMLHSRGIQHGQGVYILTVSFHLYLGLECRWSSLKNTHYSQKGFENFLLYPAATCLSNFILHFSPSFYICRSSQLRRHHAIILWSFCFYFGLILSLLLYLETPTQLYRKA